VARKIVRGMRRRTAPVTACIRARAWMLEPLPSLFQREHLLSAFVARVFSEMP
jgi:hypothetical protein